MCEVKHTDVLKRVVDMIRWLRQNVGLKWLVPVGKRHLERGYLAPVGKRHLERVAWHLLTRDTLKGVFSTH